MKTLIIGINSQFVHLNLAIRSLNANFDHKMELLEFNINTELTKVYGDILLKNADIILFSTYIWNVDFILKLAEDLKIAKPNLKIVLGGPEVSFTPYEMLENNNFLDYILCGECEEILPKFLKMHENDVKHFNLTGVVYRDETGKILGDTTYNIVEDINTLKPASEIYKACPENQIYYYETTRGCPFSCSYCLSGSIKDRTRYLDLERVFIDFKYFSDNNIPLVKLVDRTFNANKARAKEIIRFASEHTGNTSFHFEVGADILDDEIIELLNTAPHGKFQLEAGVQSCNDKTLEAVVRKTNFDKLKQNVKKIIDGNNVHLHLDLIAGLPYEDYSSFGNSINKLYEMSPHHLQLGFLKLLKGSRLLSASKMYGIKYRKYTPYEVISTSDITAEEIVKLKNIEEIVERYYNTEIGRKAFELAVSKSPTPFDFLEEISVNFYEKGHLSSPMSISRRFDTLSEFVKPRLTADEFYDFLESVLLDTCTLKGNIPSCVNEIIQEVDLKALRNKLLDNEKISRDEFKKAKYFITRDKVIISMNKELKIIHLEEI